MALEGCAGSVKMSGMWNEIFLEGLIDSPKGSPEADSICIHFWPRRLGIQLNLAYRISHIAKFQQGQ